MSLRPHMAILKGSKLNKIKSRYLHGVCLVYCQDDFFIIIIIFHFCSYKFLAIYYVAPRVPMLAFLLEIHHFINASKVIALKVFLFGKIMFPLVHGMASLSILLSFTRISWKLSYSLIRWLDVRFFS